MRVDLNLYNTNSNRQNKNISMRANLPNFVKYFDKAWNLGNETEFNIQNTNKVLSLFKNKYLASILSGVIKNNAGYHLPQNTIDFFTMFDGALENVRDKKIINYVNRELKIIASKDFKDITTHDEIQLSGLLNVADAYNTLKGIYTRLSKPDIWCLTEIQLEPSLPKGYLDVLKNMPKVYSDFKLELLKYSENLRKRNFCYPVKDFIKMEKFDPLTNFGETRNAEIENYIYEKYYLKSKTLPLTHRKILSNIYKNYGVKTIMSDGSKDNIKVLKMIEEELQTWKTYSKGTAKYPPTLVVTQIHELFGNGSSKAFVDAYDNLYINNKYNLGALNSTLRHELTHINEQKRSVIDNYTGDNKLSKLVNSIIKSKEITTEKELKKTVLDFDNCKYREEFLKAGISPYYTRYAYTNKSEFLGVIVKGDLSKCSKQFKNDLVEMGLPEYMLDMPCTKDLDIAYNAMKVEDIMREHPEVKTYDDIMKYYNN